MCDTFVASPTRTSNRTMIFGKNSDRQRNEAQAVEFFPRANHVADARVGCTYITIPQERRTHAVLLSRPFWMWGAEMGVNEHGVAIGNESLFALNGAPKDPALTGMDLVRLGLERGSTAAEALNVMTTLLERYGQGGDCGYMTPYYYNNGFMIADPEEAFVLETIDREWLVERVQGVRSISNCYSIDQQLTLASPGLPRLLCGLAGNSGSVQYRPALIADEPLEQRGQAHSRLARASSLLASRDDQVGVADAIRVLRDHGPIDEAEWNPQSPLPWGLCIHAGSDERPAQTTGALVSELRRDDAVHWVTGTAAPCISIFRPMLMNMVVPSQGNPPTGMSDSKTLWWRHEQFHRAALMGCFSEFLKEIQRERDAIEAEFRGRVSAVLNGGDETERASVVGRCWQEADALEARWFARVKQRPPEVTPYHSAWLKMNRVAGLGFGELRT